MESDDIQSQLPDQTRFTPVRLMIALFILLVILVWYVPNYIIKNNPSPQAIPQISDVITGDELAQVEQPIQSWDQLYTLIHPQDPLVKRVSDRIVSLSCSDTSNVCRAKAIFGFVQQRFRYVNDPTAFEYIKGPLDALVSQVGDCDDASVLAANLLLAVGIDVRLVFVLGHVYVEARLPDAPLGYKSQDDWVALDLTCRNCEFGQTGERYSSEETRYMSLS